MEAIRATEGNVSRLAVRLGATRQSCYSWIYWYDLARFVGVRPREEGATMPEKLRAGAERVAATVKLDAALWRAARILAIEKNRTTSAIVERAIRELLEREESKLEKEG